MVYLVVPNFFVCNNDCKISLGQGRGISERMRECVLLKEWWTILRVKLSRVELESKSDYLRVRVKKITVGGGGYRATTFI